MNKKVPVKISETDLCQPVREYFEGLGYTVHSEVKGCDMTAAKGEELVVIELKLNFNLQLLYQGTQRQRIADNVYVAVPRPSKGKWSPNWDKMCHLLRRLQLGLIIVHFQGQKPVAEVIFEPQPFVIHRNKKGRSRVQKELDGRSVDCNEGGSVKRKLMTAYRDNSIQISVVMEKLGTLSPKDLKQFGTGDKTPGILQKNFYQWYERIAPGKYCLTEKGRAALDEYSQVAEIYRKQME